MTKTVSLLLCLKFALLSAVWAETQERPAPGSVQFYGPTVADDFVFTAEQAKSPFLTTFVKWLGEDAEAFPQSDALLAIGSSSMRLWSDIETDLAPLKIVRRGFGGSRMHQVVTMQSFWDRYPCKTILVYQGDNDLVWGDENAVEENFMKYVRAFVTHTHARDPEIEIYFISPKPSPARVKAAERYEAAGRALNALAATDNRIHFIDVYPLLLDAEGNPPDEFFRRDRVHLSEAGYAIWAAAVREAFIRSGLIKAMEE